MEKSEYFVYGNFYYFRHFAIPRIALREAVKTFRTLLLNLTLLPRLWRAYRRARYVGGWRKVPAQALAAAVDDLAQTVGTYRALRELVRVEGLAGRRSTSC